MVGAFLARQDPERNVVPDGCPWVAAFLARYLYSRPSLFSQDLFVANPIAEHKGPVCDPKLLIFV